MKQTFYIFIFLLICHTGFGQTMFQLSIGSLQDDYSKDITQTSDSGFLILGKSLAVNPNVSNDFAIVKTDKYGIIQWNKVFRSVNLNQKLDKIKPTMDGGYVLVGMSDDSSYYENIIIIKLDQAGDTLWTHSYGLIDDPHDIDIIETPDSGFIFIGPNYYNITVTKIDKSGNIQWTQSNISTGSIVSRYFSKIIKNYDGNYFVVSREPFFNMSAHEVISCLSPAGNILWSKMYEGIDYSFVDIDLTIDSGMIMLKDGGTIYKTNSNGNVLWSKNYELAGYELFAQSIKSTFDGDFIVTGFLRDGVNYWSYLMMLDSLGNNMWAKVYRQISRGIKVIQTNDTGFMCLAIIGNYQNGLDFHLIKTDSMGNSGCTDSLIFPTSYSASISDLNVTVTTNTGLINRNFQYTILSSNFLTRQCNDLNGINEIAEENLFKLFPNPTNGNLTIESELTDFNLRVFSSLGQLVEERKNIFSGEIQFHLKSGLYYIQLISDNKNISRKIVVE